MKGTNTNILFIMLVIIVLIQYQLFDVQYDTFSEAKKDKDKNKDKDKDKKDKKPKWGKLVNGASNEGYGEDETALGQFVDSFENLDNVSVNVGTIRNSTLNCMELNNTGAPMFYTDDDFQLREHDSYSGYNPVYTFIIDSNEYLRTYSTTGSLGDSYMFLVIDSGWLEGKYVRIRWKWKSSYWNVKPMNFRVLDGTYDRTDDIQFPNNAGIVYTGGGLLYNYHETGASETLIIRDFFMDLDIWGNTEENVTIAVFTHDAQSGHTAYSYIDWIEVNEGSGGADNLFTIDFKSATNVVMERTGTYGDYGYVNNIDALPYSTGGYSPEGYFSTVDYLSDPNANGSALVLMVNSSIPYGTGITVDLSQNATTWIQNDWEPMFGGFESIDLRVLNFSSGFYIRYNLSSENPYFTPSVYQSRLITTIGSSTGEVSEIVTIQNVTGEWVYYNLTEINVITGVHLSGDLNSTFDIDGDIWNCSEVTGVPGYELNFTWTNVNLKARCYWLVGYIHYTGNEAHDVHVELYNFTSTSWVEIGIIVDDVEFNWLNITVYNMRIPNDFINSTGAVIGRFKQVTAGNINHDINIDFLKLYAFVPSEISVGGGINSATILMLILLFIMAILVYWGIKRR